MHDRPLFVVEDAIFIFLVLVLIFFDFSIAITVRSEVGCNNESSAKYFREAILEADPTRPITQNHHGSDTSTAYLDV